MTAQLANTSKGQSVSDRAMSNASAEQAGNCVQTPLTAPLFNIEPLSIPSGSRTAPQLPSYGCRPQQTTTAPHLDTQPASDSKIRSSASEFSSSSFSSPTAKSAPLTPHTPMSSRSDNGKATTKNKRQCYTGRNGRRPSRLARLKAALKELFHEERIDDSDLEHIEAQHWTEQ